MPSNRAVILVAVLAAIAGAVASVFFEPTIAYRLAGTRVGQHVLDASLQARAPTPPPGIAIAKKGQRVTTLQLPDTTGTLVELPDAWLGRPVLINLWATWCAPCLKEMPDLQAFSDRQGGAGVQVVGIALDETDAVRNFLTEHGIHYPVVVDAAGPADAGVRLGNPAGVLPYSVLIDAQGHLQKTRIGPFADLADIQNWAQP